MKLYILNIRILRKDGIEITSGVNEAYPTPNARNKRVTQLREAIELPEFARWDFTFSEVELDKQYTLSHLVPQNIAY